MVCGEPGGPRARQDALITRLYIKQPVRGVKLEKRILFLLIIFHLLKVALFQEIQPPTPLQ